MFRVTWHRGQSRYFASLQYFYNFFFVIISVNTVLPSKCRICREVCTQSCHPLSSNNWRCRCLESRAADALMTFSPLFVHLKHLSRSHRVLSHQRPKKLGHINAHKPYRTEANKCKCALGFHSLTSPWSATCATTLLISHTCSAHQPKYLSHRFTVTLGVANLTTLPLDRRTFQLPMVIFIFVKSDKSSNFSWVYWKTWRPTYLYVCNVRKRISFLHQFFSLARRWTCSEKQTVGLSHGKLLQSLISSVT